MAKAGILWNCPPRTRVKLEILRHYLGAWFGILAQGRFPHVYYVDGFCGPGEYSGGEEGSPVIAARFASRTAKKISRFPGDPYLHRQEPSISESSCDA
ncbi:MAG TPA: three-Cys-motif partner protein TcmP [Alphaproteobacteria bacterium]|nr:three-Cys-motif partner protein TcmP [Alphaproteobacteria bacterium]